MLNFDDDDDNRGEDANLTINVVGIEDNLLYYHEKPSGSIHIGVDVKKWILIC